MDWIIWLIVIVAIVAIIWWLLNRNSRSGAGPSDAGTGTAADAQTQAAQGRGRHDGALSGGSAAASGAAAATTGMPSAAGFGNAEPVAPTTAQQEPAVRVEPVVREEPAVRVEPVVREEPVARQEPSARAEPAVREPAQSRSAEWETQWSETAPAEPHAPVQHEPSAGAHLIQGGRPTPAEAEPRAAEAPLAGSAPVHHPEYTETHAPTLPGAESAAAEAVLLEEEGTPAAAAPGRLRADSGTLHTAPPAAAAGGLASHTAEPSGHLAVDQPYGEGSAAPAADGSAPEGFTVKGNASSMTYYDEDSPSYQDAVAEVWFASVAHAEAAGFRPPRRTRL